MDFPSHDIFIGEVANTFCDERVLSEGLLDFNKMRPLLFTDFAMTPGASAPGGSDGGEIRETPSAGTGGGITMGDRGYWSMGKRVADAWGAGKKLK